MAKPSFRASAQTAAANDDEPPPAAPAMPVPLAAEFAFVRMFAAAQRSGAVAPCRLMPAALIVERRS